MIRKFVRILAIFFIVVSFIIICFIADKLIRNEKRKLIFLSKYASFYMKFMLASFGVKPSYKNIENLSKNEANYLIVSNHLSYLDIFIIFSFIPSVFIANSELNEQFLLGTVTRYAGGVFIERRDRTHLSKEIEKVTNLLKEGFNVVLFPEATTSSGESVLPFKNPFLTCAIKANVDIVPVCIKYRKIDGEDVNSINRDLIYFYGDAKFFEHAFRLLSHTIVNVDMIELQKINVKPEHTRKELSNLAYDIINSAYHKS
ncbi:MAG: lysophospholipid acyltransferase family protein [Thermodesulfobacteriota bacterium]